MREILFRGKRVDNGKWVEGHYFTDQIAKGSNPCVDISIIRNDLHEDFEVNPKTIGQFIGLHDKNGKKVFGGDKLFVEYNHIGVVVPKLENGKFLQHSYDLSRCKIIGNIHEKEGNNG
jgi:uncharacterized phage protein (TIGR01671 family)